ncbi:hypothetical protein HY386_00150, partial [Candidatus Daviesbacteria bacterium]|nr:hypothetical protein [Candidatus Daviesbacteria bacterium]
PLPSAAGPHLSGGLTHDPAVEVHSKGSLEVLQKNPLQQPLEGFPGSHGQKLEQEPPPPTLQILPPPTQQSPPQQLESVKQLPPSATQEPPPPLPWHLPAIQVDPLTHLDPSFPPQYASEP